MKHFAPRGFSYLRQQWDQFSTRFVVRLEQKAVWLRFAALVGLVIIVVFLSSRVMGWIGDFVERFVRVSSPAVPALPGEATPAPAIRPPILPPQAPFLVSLINRVSEFNKETLQLALLCGTIFWLAYRLIAQYAFYLYRMTDFRHARHMVSSAFLPFRRRRIDIVNGTVHSGNYISVHEMYGGQIRLQMDANKGYAAVFEQSGHSIRIVGPQDRFPVLLGGFMHLRHIVDLKDQRVMVSVHGLTCDGIPVTAQRVVFICRLTGTRKGPGGASFESCDRNAVHALVYQHWIGSDWENPSKRRKALHDLVSTALEEFISKRALVEILGEVREFAIQKPGRGNQPALFQQFAEQFQQQTGQYGLELLWTEQGEWRVDAPFDADLLALHFRQAFQNWQGFHPVILQREGVLIRRRETNHLVNHLLQIFEDGQVSGQSADEIRSALILHYLERLRHAVRILEARGEIPPQGWKEVLGYLESLIT